MEKFNAGKSDERDATEGHPFVPLTPSDIDGNTSRFFNAEGRDDVVIRRSFVNLQNEQAQNMSIHEKALWLKNKATEFKKITQKADIPIANTNYIIGRNPNGEPVIFAVTERIAGKNLREIDSIDKETAEKADEMFARIISGLIESFINNEYFWYDPSSSQFMVGKAEGDLQENIYLVDVDPNVQKWDDPIFNMEKGELFMSRINSMLYYIEDMEKKVDIPGFKFSKSRDELDLIKTKIQNLS